MQVTGAPSSISVGDAKTRFIDREVLALTLGATVQRSRLYRENVDELARYPFQESLRERLQQIARAAAHADSDESHLAKILRLARDMSELHGPVLNGGRMKLAHAQKAVNLYLKYRWCLGTGAQPPHFPIDSIILREVPGYNDGKFAWTRMNCEEDYLAIVRAARRVAVRENRTLAEWELVHYRRREPATGSRLHVPNAHASRVRADRIDPLND